MAAVKTEAAITCERLEIRQRCDFNFYSNIFEQARHEYDTADITRLFPTSAAYRIQNGGSGNLKWK